MTELTLHVVPPSHPCRAVARALEMKGLAYETHSFTEGPHNEEMERIYGEGKRTVPGLLVDGEPVHGSRAIFARLDELTPEPALYPEPIAEAVREADRWGDEEFQDLGRHLPFGALYFRPEALGTFAGSGALDPAGTDYAIRMIRALWKYHGLSCELVAADLAGLPGKLAHIEELAEAGVIDGEEPNAADLQIGSTAMVLGTIGDLRPLLAGTAAERLATRFFDDYPGAVPAGAYPAGWVPEPATTA